MATRNFGTEKAFLRFLIRDPNGDLSTDTELVSNFFGPAVQEWFEKSERRPSATMSASFTTVLAGTTSGLGSTAIDEMTAIENAYFTPNITGGNLPLIRSEWNRIRYKQENEGLTGMPREWGCKYNFAAGVANDTSLEVALYPIPTEDCLITLYGLTRPVSYTTTDASVLATDPVTTRYITRLAAYRNAVAVGRSQELLDAITASLPRWSRAAFNIDRMIDSRKRPKELTLKYRREDYVA